MDLKELTAPKEISNPYIRRLFKILEDGNDLKHWSEIPALRLLPDSSVSRKFHAGAIPGIKIGSRWFSDLEVILDFLKNNQPEAARKSRPMISPSARRAQIEQAMSLALEKPKRRITRNKVVVLPASQKAATQALPSPSTSP